MRFFQIDVKNKDSLPETKAYFYGQEDIKNVPIHSRPLSVPAVVMSLHPIAKRRS